MKKSIWAVVLVTVVVIGVLYVNNQVSNESWRTYENPQLGISFKYPESWGDIIVQRREVCGGSQFNDASETKSISDPCIGVSLKTHRGDVDSEATVFLYTETPLFDQNEPPRGDNWTRRVSKIDDSFIENYCQKREDFVDYELQSFEATNACTNPQFSEHFEVKYYCSSTAKIDCSVFTNEYGVRIAKGFEAYHAMAGFHGWLYFMVTPNPMFPAIILGSSGPIDDPIHDEFDRMVDSIRFLRD